MYLSPEAQRLLAAMQRLLADVQRSHTMLLDHFHADEAHRRAFRAIYEAFESALGDVDDAHLNAPMDGGWSPARALVHIAEHDQKIEEATQRGIEHMIEHGLEHARSLWLARLPQHADHGGG